MKRSLMTLTMAVTLLGMGSVAPAAMIDLGTLDQYAPSSSTFTLDGLTFSDFTVQGSSGGGAIAINDGSEISLYGEVLPSGRVVISFNSSWTAAVGQFSDTRIRFKVTADSDTKITGNVLDMTSGLARNGAIASIIENIKDAEGGYLGDKAVYYNSVVSPSAIVLEDYAAFSLESVIWVNKDISVIGGAETLGFAHISGFSQGFDTEVPEPGTLAILGAGGLLVAQARRRKKA